MTYKGCRIFKSEWAGNSGYVWEETHYGAESDDMFDTVEAAKADIDLYFGNGPAPVLINNELLP